MDGMSIQIEEEEQLTQDPDFWNDPKSAEEQLRKIARLKSWVDGYKRVKTAVDDLQVLVEFQDKGVQADQIPRDVLKQLKAVTQEVLKEEAAKDADFKRVYESQQEFMESYKVWDTRAYVPADL